VAAIYRFARTADDFADEGDLPSAERLAHLNAYREQLGRIETGRPVTHPIFLALQPVIAGFNLPLALFRDLLDAFEQDVSKDRYADFTELMDYCRRSANPVGRLLLHLFGHASEQNLNDSDAVCSALQLINHWQDVGIDVLKGTNGRIYLPQQDMQRFNVADDSIMRRTTSTDFLNLMRFQVGRARALMLSGSPLGWRLPGRIGLEIRAIIAGGLRILDKIEAVDYDVFAHRPTLKASDWPSILWHTLVRPP
jgi:squalene synthase HpnC